MKKKLIIKIIVTISVLLLAVGLGVGGYFIYNAFFVKQAEIEDSDALYSTTLMEKPKDGSDPTEYNVEENVAIALWTIENTEEFWTLTSGVANAAGTTQDVYNLRVVKGDKAMITMISYGLVKTGKQRYFLPDKVLLRDGTVKGAGDAEWNYNDTPECVSYDTIKKRYGWLPWQGNGYIICSDTYINKEAMKMTDNGDGTYTLSFDLDPAPDKAPFWYRREVLTNSGSSIIPEFHSVHIDLTIDKEWKILVSDIAEQYKVKAVGVEAVTKTNCHEEFHYDDVEFDNDSYQFFESYAYLEALDDADTTEPKVDPMGIIVESLQNKDGSDSIYDISISVGDNDLNGTVALNITDLENIKVFAKLDDLYVEYTDSIYISIGGVKVKANIDELSGIISKITDLLPKEEEASSGVSLDVSQIMADLSASEVIDEENHVTINSKLNLLGIELPLHFEIDKVEDSYSLKSAKVELNYNGTKITIGLKETSNTITPKNHNEFSNVKNIEFIVDYISEVLTKKKTDIEISTTIEGLDINVLGTIDFKNSLEVDAIASIANEEYSLMLNVNYSNDTIYLNLDGIKLKITTEDLMEIIGKFTDVNTPSISLEDIDLNSILQIVFSLDYDELLKKLVIEENNLELELGLKQIVDKLDSFKLSLKKTTYGLSGMVSLMGYTVEIKAGNLGYQKKDIIPEEYQNLGYLTGLLDGVLAIVDAKKLAFSLAAGYQDITITGNGIVDFNNTIAAKLDLNLAYNSNTLALGITYCEDTIYLDALGLKLKITVDDVMAIVKQFTDKNTDSISMDIPTIINTVLSIDYHALIEDLTIVEDGIDVTANLSQFIDSIETIKLGLHQDKDNINVNISIDDISANMSISQTNDSIVVPEGEYQNLGYLNGFITDCLAIYKNKKLAVQGTITYDPILVDFNGIVDYSDSISLGLAITVEYDSNTLKLDAYYLDDTLYVSYNDIHLILAKKDLMDILLKYGKVDAKKEVDISSILDIVFSLDYEKLIKSFTITSTTIAIDADLTDLLEALGTISLAIERKNGITIGASILDATIDATIATTKEDIVLPEYEYSNLADILGIVDAIVNLLDDTMEFDIHVSYKDIIVTGKALLNASNGVQAKAKLTVSYNSESLDLGIAYIEDILYVSLENIKLKITKNDLTQLIDNFSKEKNTIDIEGIMNTILSIDFNKLIDSLVIDKNDVKLELNLDAVKEKLGALALELKKDDGIYLSINVLDIVANLVVNKSEELITIDDEEYQNLGYLHDIIDSILAIVDSKNLDFSITAMYGDIKVNGNGIIDFNDSIEANVQLELVYNEESLGLDITYCNDTIYLDTLGLKLMMSKSDVMELVNSFSDGSTIEFNLDTILDILFSIDFNEVVKSLIIEENSISIDANLSSLVEKIDSLRLGVSLDKDNALALDIDVLGIGANITVHNTSIEVKVPEGEYYNLGYLNTILGDIIAITKSKKIGLDISLSYDTIQVTGSGIIDFSSSIKASINLVLALSEDNTLPLDIYYIEDQLYLSLGNAKLTITKDDLIECIAVFKEEKEEDSFDLNAILDIIFSMDFDKLINEFEILENKLGITIDVSEYIDFIKAIKLEIEKLDDIHVEITLEDITLGVDIYQAKEDIILPEEDYQDLGKLIDVLKVVDSIIDTKGVSLGIHLAMDELAIDGDAKISFVSDLMVEANLTVQYSGLEVNLTLYYDMKDNMLYLSILDNNVSLSLDELMGSKEEVNPIELLSNIKLNKILAGIAISSGISIDLDLSDFEQLEAIIDTAKKVRISIDPKDDGLVLLAENLLDLNITANAYDKEITIPEVSYISLDGMVEDIMNVVSWIGKESIHVAIDGSISIKDISITLDGALNLVLDDNKEYMVDGILHLIVLDTYHEIKIQLVSDVLYVSYGGLYIGIELSNIDTFLEELLSTLDIQMDSFDFAKLNPVLDSLVIGANSLSINLSKLIEVITTLTIAIDFDEDVFSVDITGKEINLDVDLSTIHPYSITTPIDYIDKDDILSLCKTVKNIMDLVDRREFNLNLALSVYHSINKYLDVSSTIGVKLTTEEWKDFAIDDISMTVKASIIEYNEDGTIKVTHRVDLTLVEGMLYIIYGNNESDLNSKIKLYTKVDSLMGVASSLTQVLGIDLEFLEEFKNAALDYVDFTQLKNLVNMLLASGEEEESILDISSKLHAVSILSDGINVELLANILNDSIPEDRYISATIVSTEENPIKIEVAGLYTDYVSDEEYTLLAIPRVELVNDAVVISKPASTSGWYDLSNIHYLVDGILATASNRDFAFSGDVALSVLGIDIVVPVDAKARVLDDGSPLLYFHLDMTNLGIGGVLLSSKDVYIYYMSGYVYISRVESKEKYEIKITYQEFFSNIMYYLLDFAMGMPAKIMSAINSSSGTSDYVVDAGDVLTKFTSTKTKFTVGLDMKALTGNGNLGDLALSLNLSPIAVSEDEDEVHLVDSFTSISDFSFSLVSILSLKSDAIALTNLKADAMGNKWFTTIDMTNVYDYIDSYSYPVDCIYKNGSYNGRRSHSVTFVLKYLDSEIFSAVSGTPIRFPEIEVVTDSETSKNYVFTGWYQDKYCKVPYTGKYVSDKDIVIYAGYKDVYYHDLVIHSMDGNTAVEVYNGKDLTTLLEKNIYTDSSSGKTYILKGYSYTVDGELVDITTMPNSDLELYAIWEEITYKIYVDGLYKEDVSMSMAFANEYMLKADDVYFGFAANTLTYDVLMGMYAKYATIDEGYGYFDFVTALDSSYYTVTFDVKDSFNDKVYSSVSILKDTAFNSSYLPNGTDNGLSINYWYNDLEEYHLGNIALMSRDNKALKAYYASTQVLEFGYDSVTNAVSVTNYTYTGTDALVVIFPKYVLVNEEYKILESLQVSTVGDDNVSPFTGKSNVGTIYLNDGFRIIGDNAFKNCSKLTGIYFPESIESVATDAFYMKDIGNYEANRDVAVNIRFYCATNGSITSNTVKTWLACKWNLTEKYYGNKYTVLGSGNFTNAYNTYSGSLRDLVHNL